MKITLSIILLIAISGIQSPSFAATKAAPKTSRIAWPEDEYASLVRKGKNSVSGQAFLKTRGGDVKTAAGESVVLTPVTSYSKKLLAILNFLETAQAKRDLYPELDKRYSEWSRETIADASGKFNFHDVPPGEYFIYTRVVWQAPGNSVLSRQGGVVSKQVTIKDDERNEFILTK